MERMAREWCQCADEHLISNNSPAISVMDHCKDSFLNKERYPVFYYTNSGIDLAEEGLSNSEIDEIEKKYNDFCEFRGSICGH